MRWRGVERERVQSEWQLEMTPHAGHAEDALPVVLAWRREHVMERVVCSGSSLHCCGVRRTDEMSMRAAMRVLRWVWCGRAWKFLRVSPSSSHRLLAMSMSAPDTKASTLPRKRPPTPGSLSRTHTGPVLTSTCPSIHSSIHSSIHPYTTTLSPTHPQHRRQRHHIRPTRRACFGPDRPSHAVPGLCPRVALPALNTNLNPPPNPRRPFCYPRPARQPIAPLQSAAIPTLPASATPDFSLTTLPSPYPCPPL
ncbi:hypothetical protein GGP41_007033 [Bipolaris sorokiniana]|uniref:Uncharacterized protein n=1 Tax=Cochliobolus sativus TaxID=45130 RepID=A0A8H5ZRF6_COCSA|nr:hypothetical protein GGP41_007033 [Bipolaris sorokiniana]